MQNTSEGERLGNINLIIFRRSSITLVLNMAYKYRQGGPREAP